MKIFYINDPFGIKMLIRLTLRLKLRPVLKTLNPLFSRSIEARTTTHNFLRCYFYNSDRAIFMNDLEKIPTSFSPVSDNNLISLLLYGDDKFDDTKNRKILMSAIRFVKDSESFNQQLF